MRLITTAIVLVSLGIAPAALGQAVENQMGDVTGNAGIISQFAPAPAMIFTPSYPTCLTVQPGIALCGDGSVKVPKGMKMTAAARRFVAALQQAWPAMCQTKGKP